MHNNGLNMIKLTVKKIAPCFCHWPPFLFYFLFPSLSPFLFLCTHVCIYMHMYIYIYTHIYLWVYIYLHVHMHNLYMCIPIFCYFMGSTWSKKENLWVGTTYIYQHIMDVNIKILFPKIISLFYSLKE